MAYNNAWVNHRLLGACAKLTQAELEATRTGFFSSLQATLNHILIIDWFYVDALEGGVLGPAAWSNRIPCPAISELRPAQAAVDRRLIAWCESLDEVGVNQTIQVHRGTCLQLERADRLLLHLFQHQIHHRGQAHAMLSSTRVPPPQLDEFFSVAEAPLRAAEFGELGWTEAKIWGEIAIRSFADDDASQVKELFIAVNRLLSSPNLRDTFETYIERALADEIGRISAYYGERKGGFWVAVAGDEVVGMFGLEPASNEAMELRRMYVKPSARRRGIARQMLQFAEDECRRRNISRLELSTAEIQTAALALYRTGGYDLVREETADVLSNKTVGSGLRRYFFEKHLR
jgi:uncharacterized damage-inducible protein DinB/GNAT superfamily N-acetyltransferase